MARYPLEDLNYRTSSDVWVYRGYTGNLYHAGEQSNKLERYSQGDCVTCLLDLNARTLSFGKNGEVLHFIVYCFVVINI